MIKSVKAERKTEGAMIKDPQVQLNECVKYRVQRTLSCKPGLVKEETTGAKVYFIITNIEANISQLQPRGNARVNHRAVNNTVVRCGPVPNANTSSRLVENL